MFVRNAWYVAAWADEIGERPLARRILKQVRLLETPNERLVDIHGDAARIHARRVVERLIAEESTIDAGNPETSNRSASGLL